MKKLLRTSGSIIAVLAGISAAAAFAQDNAKDPPSRDNWLGFHRDLRQLPRLRAFVDLLVARLSSR